MFTFRSFVFCVSIIFFTPQNIRCQTDSSCKILKNGIFYNYPKNSPVILLVERSGEVQKQITLSYNDTSIYKIEWESDCSYSLEYQGGTKINGAMEAFNKKHKRIVLISGVTNNYYLFKMYEDKIGDADVEEDTLWFKNKLIDTRVNNKDLSEASFPGG